MKSRRKPPYYLPPGSTFVVDDPLDIRMPLAGRHPSSERFHQILKEIGELHNEKSKGYGTDADPLSNVRSAEDWGIQGWIGGMIRAGDKLRRLQAYAQKGELPFESVEDDLRDIASYAVISLVLFEQEQIKS